MKVIQHIVAAAALVAAMLLPTLAHADEAAAQSSGKSPEGLWTMFAKAPDGTPGAYIVTFNTDKTMTVDSGVAPTISSVTKGYWKENGDKSYVFTIVGFDFDEQGGLACFCTLKGIVTLSDDGDKFVSNAVFYGHDAEGNLIVKFPLPPANGVRVKLEAPDPSDFNTVMDRRPARTRATHR